MTIQVSKKWTAISIAYLFSVLIAHAQTNDYHSWKAQWIATSARKSLPNTWLAYRKKITIEQVPGHVVANIAADSKYWLWINGRMVVFEGGLKRGPDPAGTYYDAIDIAPYLTSGENCIAVLVWYFGKNGFSHKSSGAAGLIIDCQATVPEIISDKTWKCTALCSYQTAGNPLPNFRLPESNILYDARLELSDWQLNDFDDSRMSGAVEFGSAGSFPWNNLIVRPIPFWKDAGLKSYINQQISSSAVADTVICRLPYDAQITPYLEAEADAGKHITICTDNYLFFDGGGANIRAEYITRKGRQRYESLGWLNGNCVYYIVPKGVKVFNLMYRETGYDTQFAGSFNSSDPFLNTYWEKARRTLYLTMRDNYMDCPDRERAQWAADAAISSGEAYYALSPSSNQLTKKWLHELIGWQRPDNSLYAPVPSGNWSSELPDQSAASVGYFGLWNYYLHTGDKQTIRDLYDGAKRYLHIWKKDKKGTVRMRKGGWQWGDWGDNRDLLLLFNAWYYSGIKGLYNIAKELGKNDEAEEFGCFMNDFKLSFNKQFWNGTAYRSPKYKSKTDDRAQALAVVTGLADKDKYPFLLQVFQTEEHASPYMEKYVFEAMFMMGYGNEGLIRFKKRFSSMVNNPGFTTLFEGWGIGKDGFGGGTVNHSWSGGGLTVLAQYLCGLAPVDAGYKTFQILPQPASVSNAAVQVSSVAGVIKTSFVKTAGEFVLTAEVPLNTMAIVGIPDNGFTTISLNGLPVWENGQYISSINATLTGKPGTHIKFKVNAGKWQFRAGR